MQQAHSPSDNGSCHEAMTEGEEHRGKGVGQSALTLLKDEVFGTTFAMAVCISPSVKNERAVRAYEKAGFRWKRIWNDPHMGPSWFMVAERPRR